MKYVITFLLLASFMGQAFAARARIDTVSRDPHASVVVMDAATGAILHEENADTVLFPASMVKMMVTLLVMERLQAGEMRLGDYVHVTAEAQRMGGAQVYLAEGELFTVDDMLYALSIKSANDVAVALAIHVAGSKEAFVDLMNKKASALGLTSTRFASVHGLPPDEGQQPDRSTARDMANLSRELLKYRRVLMYSSAKKRGFRNNTFEMTTHNRLLYNVEGCDGLKTGYFTAAGFSIAATAQRDGRRVIAVVMGSKVRQIRDQKAAEFLEKGFALLPSHIASRVEPASTVSGDTRQVDPEVLSEAESDAVPVVLDVEVSDTKSTEQRGFPWLIIFSVPAGLILIVFVLLRRGVF